MSLPIFPGDLDDFPAHACPECADPMPADQTCPGCLAELSDVVSLGQADHVSGERNPR